MTIKATIKRNLDIIAGKEPENTIADAEAYTEQNDLVFNLANVPKGDHVESLTPDEYGIDPFFQEEPVPDIAPYYEQREVHGSLMAASRRPPIPVIVAASEKWYPHSIILDSAYPFLLQPSDPTRITLTIVNGSGKTVYVSRESIAGPSPDALPIPTGTSIEIPSCDQVYISSPDAASATPLTIGYYVMSEK